MNIGIVVKPQPRGQITLPKKYRDELGISPQSALNISIETKQNQKRIVVEPIKKITQKSQSQFIKPKINRKQYLKFLKSYKGGLWTKEDDRLRKKLLEKDEERAKKLNW